MVYFYTKEISAVSDSGEKAMTFLLSETIFVDIWYVTRIVKKVNSVIDAKLINSLKYTCMCYSQHTYVRKNKIMIQLKIDCCLYEHVHVLQRNIGSHSWLD